MHRSLFAFSIAAVTLSSTLASTFVSAQEATPTAACSVTPRSEEEIAGLIATPATPAAETPMALPDGPPANAAVIASLNETLSAVRACALTGDLGKLLALYSDAYVASVALAPEPVVIVPGERTPDNAEPIGTPAPEADVDPTVEAAVALPDGRIAARVSASGLPGTTQIVIFVDRDGRWVIDEIHPAVPGTAPSDLPAAVQAAIAQAAQDLGVGIDEIELVSFDAAEWPDSSLGCPVEGEFYMQVITPGYRVMVAHGGQQLEYHTDESGIVRPCE